MTAALPWVLIVHEVDDYDAWKLVFDGAAGLRRDAGERSYQVFRGDPDAATVVHLSQWTTLGAARAFFESPQLQRIRDEAGVHAPAFHYLDEVAAGEL